jgi:ring-1,2-phenylacetyl-CoA epoxidase subunit PaaE
MLKFHPLEVAELRVEPEEAVYLSFAVPPALRDEYRFAAGQHIGIRGVLDGEEVRRTYSLVNAPGGDTLQIGVRLHAHGRMSQHLARNVRVGDRLEVLTPNGSFHSRAQSKVPRTVVAFAAGCGITPALSIVRTILATSPASRVTLFYGNRTTSRIMLLEELQALKDQFVGQLSLQFIFSGEPQDVELFNGRIDATKVKELARVLFDANAVDEFFVCGPGDMNEQVGAALQALGVAAERIHSERFTVTGAPTPLPAGALSATPAPVALTEVEATAGVTTVSVLMDGRRRSFDMERDGETVLEAAERAGFDLPFSCRAGVCSTCRTKVVKGAVEMAQNYALEPWEVEAGFVLACQSRPTTPQLEVSYDER